VRECGPELLLEAGKERDHGAYDDLHDLEALVGALRLSAPVYHSI
jgi:hypothetical protein